MGKFSKLFIFTKQKEVLFFNEAIKVFQILSLFCLNPQCDELEIVFFFNLGKFPRCLDRRLAYSVLLYFLKPSKRGKRPWVKWERPASGKRGFQSLALSPFIPADTILLMGIFIYLVFVRQTV